MIPSFPNTLAALVMVLICGGSQPQWMSTPQPHSSTFTTPAKHVSIAELLDHSSDYHRDVVAVRGIISQPELHLDDTEFFFNFVFRLTEGDESVLVFGQHDRTQGAPTISLNVSVEVIGVFWKERTLHGSLLQNIIEASAVNLYPSLIPESA